jgi:hypothetical protein
VLFRSVPRGVTLRLAPGTRILFVPEDRDGDDMGDARLRVEGTLKAVGTPDRPVVFTSAGGLRGRHAGDWDAILFNFSRENEFRYAVIEYSSYAVHAHFSGGSISRCLIRRNLEGSRLGNSEFLLEENLVKDNVSKGFNFRGCANTVRRNEITGNGNGIFFFEKDAGSTIGGNNIHRNLRYNLRLDDFFTGEVTVEDDWWGSADEAAVRETIYDSRQDREIGTVHVRPAPAPHPILDDLPFPNRRTDAEMP